MEYLTIRNWDKWQSYRSDRGQPPWIKIHRCVMRDPEWVSLSDADRGQLVSLWLLAADNNGKIPNDPELIKRLCFMTEEPNISKFMELKFINTKKTPKRRQPDVNTTNQSRVEENRVDKSRGDKKAFIPPLIDEVTEYFITNGYTKSAGIKAWQFYDAADWIDSRKNPVKNWKQKMIGVWFRDENKEPQRKYKKLNPEECNA